MQALASLAGKKSESYQSRSVSIIFTNWFLMSFKSSDRMESHRSTISSGIGYIQAAMPPAIAPIVSESPPREMAKRITSSKETVSSTDNYCRSSRHSVLSVSETSPIVDHFL